MILRTTLFGNVYNFSDVKEVLAKANEEKSGDRLAGIIASSTEERVAAKVVLSELTIGDLRNKEPNLNRPFKVSYPVVPAIALVIALVFLVAVTISNLSTVSWVVGAYALAIIYYFIYSKMQGTNTEESNEDFNEEIDIEAI